MKRYDIQPLPFGGTDPRESDTGQWVKFEDIADILDEIGVTPEHLADIERRIQNGPVQIPA